MKNAPNRFRLPVQKLSWWADFRIQRRLKAEANARLKDDKEGRGWGSFFAPQYAMATLCAAIVTVSMFGYTWGPSYFSSVTNKAETNELQGVPELSMMMADPSFGYAAMPGEAMPMAEGARLMADPMGRFPEGVVDIPLALYSPVYSPENLSVDLAEMEIGAGEGRMLQEVSVAEIKNSKGYDVTFTFIDGEETSTVFEGHHENYERLMNDILLYLQAEFGVEMDAEFLEEYLVGDVPAK